MRAFCQHGGGHKCVTLFWGCRRRKDGDYSIVNPVLAISCVAPPGLILVPYLSHRFTRWAQ